MDEAGAVLYNKYRLEEKTGGIAKLMLDLIKGCRFDGWDEFFRYDTWMQAFADCGIRVEDVANRARSVDDALPWDHIDCGVTKQYLLREWEKAQVEKTTRDCRQGCNGCGADCFNAGWCV